MYIEYIDIDSNVVMYIAMAVIVVATVRAVVSGIKNDKHGKK